MKWEEPDFFNEETLWNYRVDTKRKKIWAVELDILWRFDRLCRKYDIPYFAEYGTLLGAVRHEGFIPWDDDIDVSMMREDFQRFKEVAKDEFEYPYLFMGGYEGYAVTQFAHIMNLNTTEIVDSSLPAEVPQGISIDIMPLDAVSDGTIDTIINYGKLLEYWGVIKTPLEYFDAVCEGKSFKIGNDRIVELAQMQNTDKFREFEKFAMSLVGTSKKVNVLMFQYGINGSQRDISWYDDVVMLPFEGMQIPCPQNYHEVLTAVYGDYMEPRIGEGCRHVGAVFDPDRPYTEYVKAAAI